MYPYFDVAAITAHVELTADPSNAVDRCIGYPYFGEQVGFLEVVEANMSVLAGDCQEIAIWAAHAHSGEEVLLQIASEFELEVAADGTIHLDYGAGLVDEDELVG